jgi:branched-chain amino acid transport system substrate-binding protein
LGVTATVAGAAVLVAACGSSDSGSGGGGSSADAASKEPIVVGSVLSTTGPINIYGKAMYDATRLAIADINASGGVLGRKLTLKFYDDQSDVAKNTLYANRLALQDKPAVVQGSITSASREAMRPIFYRNKILFFHNEQWEGGVCDKNTFGTGTTPVQQLQPLLEYAMNKHGKKLYVLAADYGYGQISADWVKKIASENGATVMKSTLVPLDVSDFSSAITGLQKAKPDVVVSLLVGASHTAFYRAFASAGLGSSMALVSPTFGIGNEHVTLPEKESKGITVAYGHLQELENPANADFLKKWRAEYGDRYPYVTDSAATTWTGWHVWAKAVEKAGSVERDKVIKALEDGVEYDAPSGHVSFKGGSHAMTQSVSLAETSGKGFKVIETKDNLEPTYEQQNCDLIKNPTINKQFTP